MKCPECNVQPLPGLTKPIKEGYLLKYKKRVFGKDWKENWVTLFEDSTIAWYKNKGEKDIPLGMVIIRDAPEMLAVGQYALKVPRTPTLPAGCNYSQQMAFGSRNKEVYWFLASSEDEVNEWMTAISNTLPLAPSIPPEKGSNGPIMFYNSKINIGSSHASIKPVLQKCKDCCTTCDYSNNYCMKQHSEEKSKCCEQKTNHNYKKIGCECCTGLLMGHTMANVASGWRGWGEGIGWQVLGLCGMNYYQTAAVITDHSMCLSSYDMGEVDYENGIHTSAATASTHEITTVLDSTNESTGFLSFDFFI